MGLCAAKLELTEAEKKEKERNKNIDRCEGLTVYCCVSGSRIMLTTHTHDSDLQKTKEMDSKVHKLLLLGAGGLGRGSLTRLKMCRSRVE